MNSIIRYTINKDFKLYNKFVPNQAVVCDCTALGEDINLFLPDARSSLLSMFYVFRDTSSTNNIILNPKDNQLINGTDSFTLKNNKSLLLVSNGTNWLMSVFNLDNNIYGDTAYFGDETNYSKFESDGSFIAIGNATATEDLNFDISRAGGPAVSIPDYVTINNVIHREFTSANNQLCGGVEEIPHKAGINKTLYPHIHFFLKSGESAGTTGVTFTFYWELRQVGVAVSSGSVALSATSSQLTASPNLLRITDETGFAGPSTLGSQLAVTLARTGGDAGDVIPTTYGIHYEVDSIGSREINLK